ncbi:MAG: hypothetical protein Q9168_005626, partial [Polycauliona sp. 1 TL-2023]
MEGALRTDSNINNNINTQHVYNSTCIFYTHTSSSHTFYQTVIMYNGVNDNHLDMMVEELRKVLKPWIQMPYSPYEYHFQLWRRIVGQSEHDIMCAPPEMFISSRGNEYFCEIDEDYLTDRFNLTNLNTDVQYYQYALDLVTDVFDLDCDDEMREQIEKSARHLYGLVHASKRKKININKKNRQLEKYKKSDFGKCPRVLCHASPLLPTGMSDNPHIQSVKLYCARCEDLYNPKSSRHSNIDGAYFGTSFTNILFQ